MKAINEEDMASKQAAIENILERNGEEAKAKIGFLLPHMNYYLANLESYVSRVEHKMLCGALPEIEGLAMHANKAASKLNLKEEDRKAIDSYFQHCVETSREWITGKMLAPYIYNVGVYSEMGEVAAATQSWAKIEDILQKSGVSDQYAQEVRNTLAGLADQSPK